MTYLEISIVSKLAEDIGSEINPNNTVHIQSANGSIKAAASQSCRLTILSAPVMHPQPSSHVNPTCRTCLQQHLLHYNRKTLLKN